MVMIQSKSDKWKTPLDTALRFADEGLPVIPLFGKRPAYPWKPWQNKVADVATIKNWFAKRSKFNVGVVTGGGRLTVADFDSRELAKDAYRRFGGDVMAVICETKKGFHAYFAYQSKAKTTTGQPDWRNDGGYVVAPGSIVNGHLYRWVKNHEFRGLSDLPICPEDLLPKEKTTAHASLRDQIHDVRKYLATIKSIQGEQGNKSMFRAVCVCRDSGLSESETTIELLHWNESGNAQPQWSHQELARAITSVFGSRK